jgi:hypothetical protein
MGDRSRIGHAQVAPLNKTDSSPPRKTKMRSIGDRKLTQNLSDFEIYWPACCLTSKHDRARSQRNLPICDAHLVPWDVPRLGALGDRASPGTSMEAASTSLDLDALTVTSRSELARNVHISSASVRFTDLPWVSSPHLGRRNHPAAAAVFEQAVSLRGKLTGVAR